MNPFWEIKILLVETNPTVIRMVEKALEQSKVFYFLRRIESVHDLNFELKYNRPNVIVSGEQMKGFDALQVLDAVQLFAESIPVIVLTPGFKPFAASDLVNRGAYDIIFHEDIACLPSELAFIREKKSQQLLMG